MIVKTDRGYIIEGVFVPKLRWISIDGDDYIAVKSIHTADREVHIGRVSLKNYAAAIERVVKSGLPIIRSDRTFNVRVSPLSTNKTNVLGVCVSAGKRYYEVTISRSCRGVRKSISRCFACNVKRYPDWEESPVADKIREYIEASEDTRLNLLADAVPDDAYIDTTGLWLPDEVIRLIKDHTTIAAVKEFLRGAKT